MSEEKKYQQRTLLQNKALHLYFTHLSETLNDAGLDMRKVLKPGIDIPWTSKNIKEFLWRPIQKSLLQKDSTTELTTVDIDRVLDILHRHLGEKFGVAQEFPSIETIMLRLAEEPPK